MTKRKPKTVPELQLRVLELEHDVQQLESTISWWDKELAEMRRRLGLQNHSFDWTDAQPSLFQLMN